VTVQPDLFDRPPLEGMLVAGVDEAGRGPLAGPVFAAAVILDARRPIAGLDDSKKLTAGRREALALQIKAQAVAWRITWSAAAEIDRVNILQATLAAMREACRGLAVPPGLILVDGNRMPTGLPCEAHALIGGDAREPAISAASILAKTARDAWCLALHTRYPLYAFDRHKGYGTALHLDRLAEHGPCPEHRRSFAPVRRSLQDR